MTHLRPHRLALGAVLAFSALLELYRLGQNGWANQYYSAAVRSMLGSLHNFFFVSSDPGGLITVDKPPLGLWLQTVSAAVFGFHPLSLLVPEALCGVLTVAVVYFIVAPRLGAWAGVAAAAALAVFPSFVASARDNNLDALLILLMALACLTGLCAVETGGWRWLAATVVLVGLAFNTKTLAAYLVVPGLGVGWLVCAPGSLRRRAALVAGATVVLAAVSLAWVVVVALTPASQRPFVGGTTDNSELSLSFGHNGLGRVLGERNAPGNVVIPHHYTQPVPGAHARRPGSTIRHAALEHTLTRPSPPTAKAAAAASPASPTSSSASLRALGPTSSVGPSGPLRLFDHAVGDQDGWLLAFALIGTLALAIVVRRGGRRERRLGVLLVMGGWLVAEVVVLSVSTGIVHPYYVSALGPPVAAMVGAGAAAFADLIRRTRFAVGLLAAALAATLAVAVVLLGREHHYLRLLLPVVIAVAAASLLVTALLPRLAPYAIAAGVAASLVIPAVYSATVWQVPVNGTFPTAGPYIEDDLDYYGIPPDDVDSYRTLLAYAQPRESGSRWAVLTQGSNTAAVFILLGGRAAALGGYGTIDPVLAPAALARLVARGEVRFVALGGGYASRGGDAASTAVARACLFVSPAQWRSPHNYGTGAHPIYAFPRGGWNLSLYDCAGRTRQIAAA
jgi:4-amino-4-deoxy-L-arabinose transferase-like glycosyltransferase